MSERNHLLKSLFLVTYSSAAFRLSSSELQFLSQLLVTFQKDVSMLLFAFYINSSKNAKSSFLTFLFLAI